MKTLTILTSIFAPLTLITGICGMNFENMPAVRGHDAWGLILLAMLLDQPRACQARITARSAVEQQTVLGVMWRGSGA